MRKTAIEFLQKHSDSIKWGCVCILLGVGAAILGGYWGEKDGYEKGLSALPPPKTEYIERFKEHAYIANVESMVYHRNGCFSLPYEDKRIYFDDLMIAEGSGYRPCGNCIGKEN